LLSYFRTKVQPGLPLKINEDVTWVDVEVGEDELIYLYEIRGVAQSKIDQDTMTPKIKMSLIPYLKNQRGVEGFFK
jgi:hypothetical protein